MNLYKKQQVLKKMVRMRRSLRRVKRSAEYDVYIHHGLADEQEGNHYWERKTTTSNIKRALLKAKNLRDSKRYGRVEVKKRLFDSRHKYMGASTLKIYDQQSRDQMVWLFLFIGLCCLGAVGFFLLF